jgi:hypothetical protein
MNKHVWQHTTIDNIKLQDAIDQFESVKSNKSLIPDRSLGKRKEHSFIVTTNRMDTQKELDAISTNIYAEYILNNPDYLIGKSKFILPKQINVMNFNTSVALVHLTLRPFENWIFKNFFLKIHRSQTDYNNINIMF